MHNWTSPETIKKKRTTPKACPETWNLHCCKCQSNSRAVMKKGSVGAAPSYVMSFQWKLVSSWYSGQLFNTHLTDVWDNEKWPAVSLYFDELLISKVSIQRSICLDKHSPKGSCHLDESSMNHTLAQKHLCEFWCGTHRTCKNTSFKPDRRHWMTRSDKQCEVNLSKSLLDESNRSDAAQSSFIGRK